MMEGLISETAITKMDERRDLSQGAQHDVQPAVKRRPMTSADV